MVEKSSPPRLAADLSVSEHEIEIRVKSAKEFDKHVADYNAAALPGFVASWGWGWRGPQYTISKPRIEPGQG